MYALVLDVCAHYVYMHNPYTYLCGKSVHVRDTYIIQICCDGAWLCRVAAKRSVIYSFMCVCMCTCTQIRKHDIYIYIIIICTISIYYSRGV